MTPVISGLIAPPGAYRYAAAILEANQICQAEPHGLAYELGWTAAIDFLRQREVPLTPDELARILYTDPVGIQRLISNGKAFWPTVDLGSAREHDERAGE